MDNGEDYEEDVLLTTLLVCTVKYKRRQQRRRRWWVRPFLLDREEHGQACRLAAELRAHDEEYFRDYIRMPPSTFDTLLELVRDKITKTNTNCRKAIAPEQRLIVTLRFLAAGQYIRGASFNNCMGRSTIASEFEETWNFPHCLGAMDGKHVVIECPGRTGSLNFNYKKTFSKLMLAICDAKYRFLYVEIGHHGSESDAGIFRRSDFLQAIAEGQRRLPPASWLGSRKVPYFFVGDEAFPLKTFVMRPFPRKNLTGRPPRVFNYRLSRARRVVENTFGILAQRWRILRRPFAAKEETTDRIVAACVILHNFLMKHSEVSERSYVPPGSVDGEDWEGELVKGQWRSEEDEGSGLTDVPPRGTRCTDQAYNIREHLSMYFEMDGKVPWQDEYLDRH
ncbi:uncharacterized protein ISCGN_013824 [Ixodes scapularis]